MSGRAFNRRRFMQLGAAGALSATAMLGGLPGAGKIARAGGPPLRFLFLYAEGGWAPRGLFMRPSFSRPEWGHWSDAMRIAAGERPTTDPEPSEFEFSFTDPSLERSEMSRILDPFWDVRSKMLAFEGLCQRSREWDPFGDGHASGHMAAATAGPAAYAYEGQKSVARYPSLDQRILEHVRETDPFAFALNFRPNEERASGSDGFHYWLWGGLPDPRGGLQRIPTDGDPSVVARRLFGDPDADPADVERRAMAERAMFAQLQTHYGELSGRMSGEDRLRLETHRGLLSELDARLARPRIACDRPELRSIDGLTGQAAIDADFDSFTDMIAASFMCDITRVATMQVGVTKESYGVPEDLDTHHHHEHESDPQRYYGETAATANYEAEEFCILRHIGQARQVARLVQRLDEIPEAGGGTLLDHTIVLYVSELANGAHGGSWCPFLVFGGQGTGAYRTGRYLKYRQDYAGHPAANYGWERSGTPHSHLYISLLRAMGLDIDHIHSDHTRGGIVHLGISDVRIEMGGALPRLA
jgi:hypothetical protein